MSASVSVVLATYNGGRFLKDQLASLAIQTHLPREVLICDDGSNDETLYLVEKFSGNAPFCVRIHLNPQRLGYADNFLSGASRATGDWIAFCDQDDVWHPNKLQRCVERLNKDKSVLALHTADVVDEQLRPLGHKKPHIQEDRIRAPGGCDYSFSIPGFAMVFDARLVRVFNWKLRAVDSMNMRRQLFAHDQWIAFLARSLGTVSELRDSLALYRQHSNNTCGAARSPSQRFSVARDVDLSIYRDRAQACECLFEFLTQLDTALAPPEWIAQISRSANQYARQADFHRTRSRIHERGRWTSRALSYFSLLSRRAYRPNEECGLGRRAAIKDAWTLLSRL